MLQFDRGDLKGLMQSLRGLARRACRPPATRACDASRPGSAPSACCSTRFPTPCAPCVKRCAKCASRTSISRLLATCCACWHACRGARCGSKRRASGCRRLADRFAVSRGRLRTAVPCRAGSPGFDTLIRSRYERVVRSPRTAVSCSVGGSPGEAARMLLDRSRATLNTKMLDLALHTLARHRCDIGAADVLLARAAGAGGGGSGLVEVDQAFADGPAHHGRTSDRPSLAISRLR